MRASATKTTGGGVALQFPYSEALIAALKDQIPPIGRRYDRDAKCWLILGAYAPTAVNLLLEPFPAAQVPDDAPQRLSSTPARTEKPPVATEPVPLPPIVVEPPPVDELPPLDPLLAIVPCPNPKCRKQYEQSVCVAAETSRTVAKAERPPAEFVGICPSCGTLIVIGFAPALPVEAAA
jgi:hypothetical protein